MRYAGGMAGTFDTHAAVKDLQEAGADERLAEALVRMTGAALNHERDHLATKTDLAELKADLRADLFKVVLATVGLTVALMKLVS